MSNKITLPKIPISNLTQPATGKMWTQPSTGSMLAVSQLHKTLHKGGRKRKALPGGAKLQPIFKNYSGPAPGSNTTFGPKVLPNIASPIADQESLVQSVMSGDLRYLPEASKTTVRVYLASNFDDMKEERNVILTRAVPQIQDYCSSLGLHFQLVDLNWGVEKEMLDNDLSLSSVHQKEIAECQRLSLGPNFVVLLGDKYGCVPLVTDIPEKEFDIYYEIAQEKDLDADLLGLNFCKDTNSSPVVYRIHSSAEDFDAVKLKELVQKCVVIAREQDKITEEQKQKYFISSIENDVNQGIVDTKDPRQHCLCYRREFQNFKPLIHTKGISDFFDLDPNSTEPALNTKLHNASARVAETVSKHLGAGNFRPFYLEWPEDGLDATNAEFKKYLRNMCQRFVRDITSMVSLRAEKMIKEMQLVKNRTLQEVIFHANQCQTKSRNFQGQQQVLSKIERFLRDPRVNNKPFVIHGEAGSGKSATMGQLVSEIKTWFTDNAVVAHRQLGSTSESSSIYKTVISITNQVCLAYGLDFPDINSDCCTLYKALFKFREVLQNVSKDFAFIRPLFILLDGIHNLQPQDEAMRALWAIRDLPPNVHIVVSTVPKLGRVDLIKALVQLISDAESSAQLDKLSTEEAKNIIKADMKDFGRKISHEQEIAIVETFEQYSQPLLLKTTIAHASEWGSFLKQSELGTSLIAEEYLSRVLDELEEQYGDLLIMSFVSYITTCPVGMQERELIDLLLADQDVEEEMHKFPNCVVNGVRYLPPYLLANIKFKLRHFLEDHEAEGQRVIAWNHRQFYEAAAQKYQVIYQGIDEDKITDHSTSYTLLLHENLVNMYLRENIKRSVSNLDPNSSGKNSLALSYPQPINVHNHMKLERVPIHLRVMTPIEGLSRTKEAVLFNYKWLLTKLKSKPVHHILSDLMNIQTISTHVSNQEENQEEYVLEDMEILFEFLQLAKTALDKNPEFLAAEILARLPKFSSLFESVKKLIEDASSFVKNRSESGLLPLFPCFKAPCGLLRHNMEGPTHVLGFLQNGKTSVMFSQTRGTDIWLNSSGELVHRFPVNPEQRVEKVIPGHENEFVLIGHYSHLKHNMDLSIMSTETGVRLVHSVFPENFEAIALNEKDNLLVVSTAINESPEDNLDGTVKARKCILGVDVQTKEVLYTIPADDIHEEGVTKLMFIPGGDEENTFLLTIGSKRSKDLGFWHMQKQCLEFKMLLNIFVEHVQVHGATAILGSARHGVLLFIDLNEGKLLKRIDESDLVDMADMLVTSSGQHVIVATAEMGINVYGQEKASVCKVIGERAESRDGRRLVPSKVALCEKEHFLVAGYETGEIIVYYAMTGQTVVRLEGSEAHTKRVNSLLFNESSMLFSAADDHVAKMWNLQTTLYDFAKKMKDLDGKLDGVQQFNEEVNEVKMDSSQPETKYPTDEDHITDFVLTPDQEHLITCSLDGPIKVWSVKTGSLVRTIQSGCENGVDQIYLACKGTILIGHCKEKDVSTANRLQVWKLSNGEPVKISSDSDKDIWVYSSCILPGDQKVFTVSPSLDNRQTGMSFCIIDLFELCLVATLHCSILGSMDCTNLRFISANKHEMYKPKTKRPAYTSTTQSDLAKRVDQGSELDITENAILAVLDYFPDASTSYFFTLRISGRGFDEINMDSSEPVHIDSRSPSCTVMLTGGRCVTGTVNGSLLVWDAGTQQKLDNIYDQDMYKDAKSKGKKGRPAHAGSVTCLSLSDDGAVLVSGGMDGAAKLWHLQSKTLIKAVQVHTSPVTCLSLSEDKELLLSGSDDPEVKLSVLNPRASQTDCQFYAHAKCHKLLLTKDRQRVLLVTHQDLPRLVVLKTINI